MRKGASQDRRKMKDFLGLVVLGLLVGTLLAAPAGNVGSPRASAEDDAFTALVNSVFETFENHVTQHVGPYYAKARSDPLLSKILFAFFALFLVKVFLFDFVSCLFCGCKKVISCSKQKGGSSSGPIDKDVIEKLRVIDAVGHS